MTFQEYADLVEKSGGVMTVAAGGLRDAAGHDRLRPGVKKKVRLGLKGAGLGHIPTEIPSNQDSLVRLYKRGTPVGEFIDMLLTPSQGNDETLQARFTDDGPDYADIVAQIRDLVSE